MAKKGTGKFNTKNGEEFQCLNWCPVSIHTLLMRLQKCYTINVFTSYRALKIQIHKKY